MFIPLGYCNLQVLFTLSNGRDAMTACGFVAEGIASEDPGIVVANFSSESDWGQDICVSTVKCAGARIVIGTSDPSAPIVYEASGAVAGGNSDPGIQPATALLLNKRTNLGGRKGRGRCFLPGLSEGQVGADGMLAGSPSVIIAAAELFWEQMTVGTPLTDPVLLHSDETTPPSPIVAFDASSQVATQRRRLRG